MTSSPLNDRDAIFVFALFFLIGQVGASVSFLRTLDLSIAAPAKIRFWAELGRRLVIAGFVSVIGYSLATLYGINPPLLWVVAAFTGTFAGELLDLAKDRTLAWVKKLFATVPGAPSELPKDKP